VRYRRFILTLLIACAAAARGPGNACAQTSALPPPAASSLDRIAQASPYGTPLPPPPPGWDAYGPQATQVFQPPTMAMPQTSTWAPSAISGQPGYPGYSTAAPSLAPTQGPPSTSSSLFPPGYPTQNSTFQQTMRLYQGARGSWAYLFGDGQGTNVGINEFDTTATFAVPFFHNSQANLNHAPLLITPGFGLQLWDGPQTTPTMTADLPSSTYDVFVDTAWNPQFTPLFGAELGLRIGIYTNWNTFVWQSWRIMGRAVGTLQLTPTMQGKAGIVYLDRNLVKMLPVIGLTWTPDADTRYDILFPTPRVTRRLTTLGSRNVWGYLAGEYGGGAWTFNRSTYGYSGVSPFDYNDIRVTLGTEFVPITGHGLTGNMEVGYVFARQLFYVDGPPAGQYQDLPSTLMLRVGLAY
jgi:hypothetical protein